MEIVYLEWMTHRRSSLPEEICQTSIFVSAKCFDLTRSSSCPPRRQIQELYYVSLRCGIPNAYKFLLQNVKDISLYIRTCVTVLT